LAVESGRDFGRVLPNAMLASSDRRLAALVDKVVSAFPHHADLIRSVSKVETKKRGGMEGLVGLTRYCCVRKSEDHSADGSPSQTITFYSDLFDEISDRSAVGVVAHEFAHAWLNEHDHPEASEKREKEADDLARR
jgi:hypothetical protein